VPPLPPPLPPEERPVGQLVAESLRLYGRRFWSSLALGVPPAATGLGTAALDGVAQIAYSLTVWTLAVTVSYVGAVLIATGVRPTRRSIAVALGCGIAAWLPVPFLTSLLFFPAAVWLALVGLVVPVALVESAGPRDAFVRAVRLALADYVHALGSIATLAIVGLLTALVLFFLLRGQGEATLAVAAFLSVLVIAPVLFLGAALLYQDQAARDEVARGSSARRRRRSQRDRSPSLREGR
jgi:hypothetical protein